MRYVGWGNRSPLLHTIGDLAQLIPVSSNAGAEIKVEMADRSLLDVGGTV